MGGEAVIMYSVDGSGIDFGDVQGINEGIAQIAAYPTPHAKSSNVQLTQSPGLDRRLQASFHPGHCIFPTHLIVISR